VWHTDRQRMTVEETSGQSDAETRDGTVWDTDREWTEFRREQWT